MPPQPFPDWLFYPALLVLVLLLPESLYIVRQLVMPHYPLKRRQESLIHLLVMVFLVGMVCKVGMIGPQWLRFYLSDLGLPAAITVFVVTRLERFRLPDNLCYYISKHYRMVYAGVFISLGYEVAAGLLYWITGQPAWLIGHIDIIDIALYVVGAVVTFLACNMRLDFGLSKPVASRYPKRLAAIAPSDQSAKKQRQRRRRLDLKRSRRRR